VKKIYMAGGGKFIWLVEENLYGWWRHQPWDTSHGDQIKIP
jgi:hypothetical protein